MSSSHTTRMHLKVDLVSAEVGALVDVHGPFDVVSKACATTAAMGGSFLEADSFIYAVWPKEP